MEVLADWIKETTATTGTGLSVTLAGAVTGFIRFADSSKISNNSLVYYVIQDGGNLEQGIGTWKTGHTLDRTTVLAKLEGGVYSENPGTRLNLSGNARVMCSATSRSFYDANALTRIQQDAAVTKSSGTHTIDLSQSYGYQKITASGNFTLAFSNVPSGVVSQFIIEAVNWGAYTVTLPTYKKEFGTALTFTSSGTDIIYCMYDSAGALTMSIAQQNIS